MTPVVAGLAAALAALISVRAGGHAGVSIARLGRPVPPRRGEPRRPAWVTEACRQLGTQVDPATAWRVLRTAAVGAVLTAAILAGPLAALLVLVGGVVGQRPLRHLLHRRRLDERDAQLPAAVERIASAIRAGAPPRAALIEVARSHHGPVADELRSVAAGIEHGEGLAVALHRWSAHPDSSPDVVLAASALGLGAEAGGQVARAVDGVAATLRERRQLRAEVRALATQARSSAWLLAAAPLMFAVLVASVEPGSVAFLLTTPPGLACLTAGLALDVVGLAWMARIVREAS